MSTPRARRGIELNALDLREPHVNYSIFTLLQRSPVKITFPLIWANTCCSHPLHVSSELIEENARGVKNAARRKLEQELGIPPEDVPLDSFTWITRVHYEGSSVEKDGSVYWGEHEIDWIMMCAPGKKVGRDWLYSRWLQGDDALLRNCSCAAGC